MARERNALRGAYLLPFRQCFLSAFKAFLESGPALDSAQSSRGCCVLFAPARSCASAANTQLGHFCQKGVCRFLRCRSQGKLFVASTQFLAVCIYNILRKGNRSDCRRSLTAVELYIPEVGSLVLILTQKCHNNDIYTLYYRYKISLGTLVVGMMMNNAT